MENNRPKIALLNEKELAQLLIECFFIIGRDIRLSSEKLKLFLKEVYKKQGWMYVDTFTEAFSRYAAFELPDSDTLRPNVSPRFISNLMKLYFTKCRDKKLIAKSAKENFSQLTDEEKYNLFTKFVSANKCIPSNPDWVSIFRHLAKTGKVIFPDNWKSLTYTAQRRFAANKLTEWACNHFNINECLLYKTDEPSHLKGIGSRLGETLWNNQLQLPNN